MVTGILQNNLSVLLSTSTQQWVADEPHALGGDDNGATPLEQVWGALAACKIITMRMYANRKQWPLLGIRVCVRHQKNNQPVDERDPREWLAVQIDLEGDLTTEQCHRLREIATRCAVHRLISASLPIIEVDHLE